MKVQDFSKIFFALLLFNLAVVYQPESKALSTIAPPLMAFALLAFFVSSTSNLHLRGKALIPAALLLIMVSDILPDQKSETFANAALLIMAIAHLCFSLFYLSQRIKVSRVYFLLVSVLAGFVGYALFRLFDFFGVENTWSYMYIIAVGLHIISSTKLMNLADKRLKLPFLGALLFGLFLFLDDYADQQKYWHIAAMLAYGLAQYTFTIGLFYYFQTRAEPSEHPSK